jgi:hypothetical protein
MKLLNYKLLALGCLTSLLTGVVHAQEVELDNVLNENYEALDSTYPIDFSPVTEFMDVACTNLTGPSAQRAVVYNLVNYEANTINLDSIKVITNNDDDSGITTTFVAGGTGNCIQTVNAGIGSGYIYGYATGTPTCTITIQVTPPACPTTGGLPVLATIDRELYIGIETRNQSELTAPMQAEVSVLGAGASFALLASSPTDTIVASTSSATITGNIGSSGTSNESEFSYTNGIFYNTQGTTGIDPVYIAAVADLEAAYDQLPNMNTGTAPYICQALNGLNGSTSIAPGCYALSVPPSNNPFYCGASTVCVDSTNELTGNEGDNYYFFVPAGVDLNVGSQTVFTFSDGGTPANVFWIMEDTTLGAGQVYINAGAQLAGSVLSGLTQSSGQPAITTTLAGSTRAQIFGTLWSGAATISPAAAIQLYGDSVTVNN